MISATGTPVASWRAGLAGGVGDREADHPHAALDVAPDRALALEVALVVHELDRRGAGVLRAAVGGDHALAEQRVLEALVLHVVVEDVGDRRVEDDVEHRLLAVQEVLDLLARRALADPGVAAAGAQPAADLVEEVLVGPVAVDVLLGDLELLEVALGLGVVEPLAERRAVLERDPQVRVGDVALEAALSEAELLDHELVEQADDVRAGADAVALVVERALERAGAAEPLPPFQHEHRLPGSGQVRRGGEPVVAAADDDRVPALGRQLLDRGGKPDLPQLGRDLVHGVRTSWSASASTATALCAWTITGLSSISASGSSASLMASVAIGVGGDRRPSVSQRVVDPRVA